MGICVRLTCIPEGNALISQKSKTPPGADRDGGTVQRCYQKYSEVSWGGRWAILRRRSRAHADVCAHAASTGLADRSGDERVERPQLDDAQRKRRFTRY
jgi:hypothetical protein